MRIVFMGSPEFAVPSLRMLIAGPWDLVGVVTQPDRPAGRGRTLTPTAVSSVAEEAGIPVEKPVTLREEGIQAKLRSLRPDLICVVACGHKLPPEVLAIPSIACANVHPSLLPKYRGAAPIQWAIINGETVTGVSTMRLNEEWDAGDVYLRKEYEIYPWETYGDLWPRLAIAGADLLFETLSLLEKGEIEPLPQDHEEATPAPKIAPEDTVVDWNAPAEHIHNRIRGLSPIPAAITGWREQRLKILLSQLAEASLSPEIKTGSFQPGEIVNADPRLGLVVATGSGNLEILEVQPPGKRAMPATDFINGYQPRAGEVLGGISE